MERQHAFVVTLTNCIKAEIAEGQDQYSEHREPLQLFHERKRQRVEKDEREELRQLDVGKGYRGGRGGGAVAPHGTHALDVRKAQNAQHCVEL